MINRSHIRKFLAVVDAGSFTQAAARIRITQPTLSSGIAELERLVGSTLFLRERKQVRLTEAGGRFLPVAREIERNFRQVDALGKTGGDSWPDLRLGAIRSVAAGTLAQVVTALGERFSIEIVEGTDAELRNSLASGRIQGALTLLRPGESEGGAISLIEEPYVMLVAETHRLAGAEIVDPEDLASEIMIARRSCELLEATSRFFTQRGIRPRFSLRSESEERCLEMVGAGMGVTTAPLSLARKGIIPVRVQGYEFKREIGILGDPAMREAWDREGVLPFDL